ncbi:MAG: aldehyde dehydrogenase family protein [Actinomycetota bacterium]|jgi:aldehyde dehydrogenase (NAD+)|nr:aldehyde dehydrogenase family protein [Actinomycetota bacterium]
MTAMVQNFVAGKWTGTPSYERANPADPSDVVAVAVASSEKDVDAAVGAAGDSQVRWASTAPGGRGRVLLDAAQVLAERAQDVAVDLVREEGKTLAEALGEVRRAVDVLRFFGAQGWRASGDVLPSSFPDTMVYTRREALGVVGVVTPWNFPIAIPAWKIAPALVSGNAVVWKPSEITSLTAVHLARALADAGLPDGVVNIVCGRGPEAGEALVAHHDVAAISFTGSTNVGLHIHEVASRRRARVQLEMGGKNAVVVLDDADVARSADTVAAGAFGLTGQACTATSRVYCTPGILDRFLEALKRSTGAFTPGDGRKEGVRMGPVVSEVQLNGIVGSIEHAKRDGASFLCGGVEPDGLFLQPTIITGTRGTADIVRNEVFGPVVVVLEVPGLDAAIDAVNQSRYGLTAGICTRDLASAQEFAARAHVGVVKVNRPTTGLDLNVPFGGVKDSSSNTFREQGMGAVDFFTWSKTVYLGHDRID